ncbi:MAG: tetratricopeptide repeat protein [Flavobacteriales bacterium]
MNKSTRAVSWMVVLTAVIFTGCAGLGSMEKEIETLSLKASPEPLILRGDQVELEITGTFPPKYFAKKVSIEAQPVLSWEGGSMAFETQGFQGEDVAGNFDVIPFESGKSFTYNAAVAFDPAMEDACELAVVITGSKGSSSASFDPYVVGSGVITTPLWVRSDDQFILVPDNFERVLSYSQEATINYLVNSDNVRSSELRDDDWKSLLNLIDLAANADSVTLTGARIEAYASPEGEISLNDNLAVERATSAANAMTRAVRKEKMELVDNFYTEVPKGEDWVGFKKLMQSSDIPDKDLIIRVLEMYTDNDKREEAIRNIAKTYKMIEKEVLPQLRRSQLVVSYDVEGYTDEELMDLCKSNPDVLTVEEILFAATLFESLNDKLEIYQNASRVHPDDFRGYNNAGWCLMEMGRENQAKELFNTALTVERNKAVVNNVAAIKRREGDVDGAMKLLNEAKGAGDEVNYNKGIILIQKGDYSSAISNMGRNNTVNVALAKMLNGDANGAKTVLDNSGDDSAIASYVYAIACARLGDGAGAKRHLTDAITKDGSLRDKASKDLEFRDVRDAIGM